MTNQEKETDKKEILRLLRLSNPNSTDINNIYSMTKKYINKDAKPPDVRCGNCNNPNSLSNMWINLGDWFSKNKNVFEPTIEKVKVKEVKQDKEVKTDDFDFSMD